MKQATFGFIVLLFWITFIMWLGFANGILNGYHPVRGSTINGLDFIQVITDTLFYFLPHTIISCLLLFKYRNESLEG